MNNSIIQPAKQKYGRIYNFSAGPSVLPLEVLEQAKEDLLNWKGKGMSLMEMSHRSKEYEEIIHQAEIDLRQLLKVPNNYKILFLQGGASLQFSMIPMNFLSESKTADYIVTGTWGEKAVEAAALEGKTNIVYNSKDSEFDCIPNLNDLKLSQDPAYVHYTANETVQGVQFPYELDLPYTLITDMSSEILSRPIDISKFGLIYAGAQKNMGPAGVTIVIIRDDLLNQVPKHMPPMLDYKLMADNQSMYNTPCCWGIYICGLVYKWLINNGGLEAMYRHNQAKAQILYQAIDQSNGFYKGHTQHNCRSLMNITFTLSNNQLSNKFIDEATQLGFDGLKGHRSIGGCRASIYNAFPIEGCKQLSEFMNEFSKQNER